VYNTNIKHDRDAALVFVNRGLAFDPANDNLLNIQKVLSQSSRPQPEQKTKTKTSAGETKTKTKTKNS
ncbi:MAG TPA: hypothetical protein VFL47_03520, partial [Flavisolibacter sp.]|nr:hypothetical protein [Flavisolibacter sp.]